MDYLPSKKFIYITSALIIAVVLAYSASLIGKKSKNNTRQSDNISVNNKIVFNSITEKDSDNDGIKDWEEALWGTDINNPDSDGDGTPDGEEVKVGRDPAIAGPNDKIDLNNSKNKNIFSGSKNNPENNNITENFSLQFLTSLMSLNKSNQLNDKTLSQLSNAFSEKMAIKDAKPIYKISDLKISNVADQKKIHSYGNILGALAQKYLQDGRIGEEIRIITEALKNNDNQIDELDPIISLYDQASNDMLNIVVPKNARIYHLSMINSLTEISKELHRIKNINSDPLKGFIAINIYRKETIKIDDSINKLKKYFDKNKIQFEKNEPGFIFTKQ